MVWQFPVADDLLAWRVEKKGVTNAAAERKQRSIIDQPCD
jgi:hypothetical protein